MVSPTQSRRTPIRMEIDPNRGITSPSGEGPERGMWDRVRPTEHTRICWAPAFGAARYEDPFATPIDVPDNAKRLLVEDVEQCKCKPKNRGSRPGRR